MLLTYIPSSLLKVLYNPRAFFTHAAWLDQACAHCPIFPTAASRRSLGRVSVPVWLIILSDQLEIVALVSHYLTNKLISRRLILLREPKAPFLPKNVCGINPDFSGLSPTTRQIPTHYSPVRRSSASASTPVTARLACVKPAASVQSEPGSNSPVKFRLDVPTEADT